jgi:hypothetical protein
MVSGRRILVYRNLHLKEQGKILRILRVSLKKKVCVIFPIFTDLIFCIQSLLILQKVQTLVVIKDCEEPEYERVAILHHL